MNRGSSRRLMRAPKTSVAMAFASSSATRGTGRVGRADTRSHCDRGLPNRGHDVVIARTATDVALDGVPDLVVRGVRVVADQLRGGHDHARSAEPALEAVLLPERRLERVERAVGGGESLDRRDAGAVGLD